jgi:hypothetical protein
MQPLIKRNCFKLMALIVAIIGGIIAYTAFLPVATNTTKTKSLNLSIPVTNQGALFSR